MEVDTCCVQGGFHLPLLSPCMAIPTGTGDNGDFSVQTRGIELCRRLSGLGVHCYYSLPSLPFAVYSCTDWTRLDCIAFTSFATVYSITIPMSCAPLVHGKSSGYTEMTRRPSSKCDQDNTCSSPNQDTDDPKP